MLCISCNFGDNGRYFCASHCTFYIKQTIYNATLISQSLQTKASHLITIQISLIFLQYFLMKRQHYKNLRYAERIKENQCFIEADGLQKKIRKFNASKTEGNVDADMKMREIQCFWKEGWQYNHTHHIYLEPKTTRPEFYRKSQSVSRIPARLEKYYELLEQFVRKLRIENEDQTNFKIEEIEFSPRDDKKQVQSKSQMEVQLSEIVEFDDDIEDKDIAQLSFLHLIKIVKHISTEMIANFQQSVAALEDNMMNEGLEESQITHLKQMAQACDKIVQKDQECEDYRQQAEQFMQLIMNIIERSKQSKIYSSVAAVQPSMGIISEFIHPISLGLYAVFSKEVLVKDAKKRRGRRYADEQEEKLKLSSNLLKDNLSTLKLLKIQDNFKVQQEKHTKTVFLNLDGYESQFNLEFIRNFADNIMYASFPKFDKREDSKHYNYRFYKKIMYNFTRSELDLLGFPEQQELQGINLTLQRQNLLLNPEKYHETLDEIYMQTYKVEDFNRNTYIFPINLDHIQSEYDISKQDKHIQGYQSHFVRFILRDQLYSAMKNFRPHSIFISFTGRITIQNEHFIEMMQELVKICPKVILFPNYTNSLNQKSKQPTSFHKIGKGIIINDEESELQRKANDFYERQLYNPYQVDLMDKLSIFLKITAGYYNVIRPFQQQDIYSKYKNSRIFRYIIHLYNGLKNQYQHCKRRIESSTLQTARACLENTLNQNSKEIGKCIPEYYKQMFEEIGRLLERQIHGEQYDVMVDQVIDQFPATFQQEQPYLLQWEQLKKAEIIQLASAKYHEISQIQIRQRPSKQQYLSLKDQKMNNLSSLYRISFFYKDQNNEIVKIYKDVTLHYKDNQYAYNKNYFYIVLTNLFTSNQRDIAHYIAKPKIGSKKLQRCQIVPVCFYDRGGMVTPAHKFKVWTEWNYAETNHHVILYWPTDFDFIHYYLSKLIKRKYQPKVIQRVFAANKSSDSLGKTDSTFYQINFGENVDVAPRWGCSGLNIDDQMYIFGGSFGSQMSYLNLQNDISTFDLTDHNLQDFAPTKLRNLRKELYCDQAFWGKLREEKDVNTFVRPRMEFEFYDREELLIDDNDDEIKKEDDYRKIYMIGGYGEQFKTPYSLFVNYYYELLIEKSTRRLVSIKKCVIPDKVIPINVKDMIKNRGIYQKANILQSSEGKDKEQQKCKEGITNNRHYFCHKVVYALKAEQLQFKIKNLFAVQIYENCKKQFMNVEKRLVAVKNQEPESVLIRKVEGSKHQVLVDIGDIYYLYSLYLQLSGDEIEEIPLMNESIISLDTKKLTIFALISHSKHTQSKCILASETVSLPSQSIIDKEKHYALILKEIATFEESLNLHTLIICNVHEVVLLHGVAFENCLPKEYLIKTKSQNKNELKRQEIRPLTVSPQQVSSITTFFAKKNNIITSINILQSSQNPHIFSVASYSLDINRFTEGWKPKSQAKRLCFVHRKTVLQKITIQARIDNYADINSVIIIIYAMKKAYHIKMSELSNAIVEIEVEELTDKKEIERYKCMECLAKLIKNEELYEDFNYFGQ